MASTAPSAALTRWTPRCSCSASATTPTPPIHLAENLAGVRYRRQKHLTVLRNGRPERLEYAEIDHC